MGTWVSQCHWPRLLLLYMCKEIQQVRSEEDQPWDFFGGNDAEAETPVLWPPHAKNWLIGKDSDAGRDWGQEEKGTTEDEDGWMASLTRWIWVWVNSGSWWWTGRPGVLQFMGSWRVGHDWSAAAAATCSFYSCFLESFYHKRMLNFVKGFLCIYWDNHMAFIFPFVNVMYYINWFADIEESLHPWDRAHLVMMYDLFNILLNSVC